MKSSRVRCRLADALSVLRAVARFPFCAGVNRMIHTMRERTME